MTNTNEELRGEVLDELSTNEAQGFEQVMAAVDDEPELAVEEVLNSV